MEACSYTMPLYEHFRQTEHEVTVAHPRKVSLITENEHKTDAADAEVLADLARVGYLPEAYLPTPAVLRIREVARERREVGEQLTQQKNQIRSMVDTHGIDIPFQGEWESESAEYTYGTCISFKVLDNEDREYVWRFDSRKLTEDREDHPC
jgi:transposase